MTYAEEMRMLLILLVLLSGNLCAGQFHSYIGQIESRSVLLAWGSTDGLNTIGRSSPSAGKAAIVFGGQILNTDKNWILVTGLEPDHSYPYSVTVGSQAGSGTVRTYPERATHLRFFLMGDYGTGLAPQREIADAMTREYGRLVALQDPPRFVLTTGDNIYADLNAGLAAIHSGDSDADWETKLFGPYSAILREIPFYPTLGNHDGNGTENRGDLPAYLDNFFFPHNEPARWYTFSFADLVQFFALDSTENTLTGRPKPAYLASGEQFSWFKKAIAASQAPWKIPYFHHPPFNAGPHHPAYLKELRAFVDTFSQSGVKVAFSGHEHNFQFTEQNQATAYIQYVISGAGGELRPGDVRGKMKRAQIAGWAADRHFLSVEINGDEMRITPVGAKGVLQPISATGVKIAMPIVVKR